MLDRAMVAVFAGPATATGEDLAEFHLHGGSAVVAGVLAAVTACAGVRLAEPGEFSRRAFANRRLDLAEVEGLADLIAAETSTQRDQALALAGGGLSRFADSWRERALVLLAEAEAGLDFAEDEADVAARIDDETRESLQHMAVEIDVLIADSARASLIRDGLTIVVSGAPNVGKSSLVNALVMRDAAIVTDTPGTTRDPVEVAIELDGIAARLIDTAGLRDTDDAIEAEGIRRARARAAAADLVVHLVEAGSDAPVGMAGLLVANKADLGGEGPAGAMRISAIRGDGIAELRKALADWAHATTRPGEPPLLTHARHRAAFADAAVALREAATADDPVLRTESLRLAARAFGRIAGRVDVDDVLDRIFSRFCIGK